MIVSPQIPMLDPGELARLSPQARSGDILARNTIAEAYCGFVAGVVRQAWPFRRQDLWAPLALDDAVQEGLIVLLDTARTWRAEEGVKFETYTALAVKRRIWKLASWSRATAAPTWPDEWDPPDDRTCEARRSELTDYVHDGLSRLNPRDRESLVLRYGIGGTEDPQLTREIGERRGYSRVRACYVVRRAERRLAEAMDCPY